MHWTEIVRLWALLIFSAGSTGFMIFWSIWVYRRSAMKAEQDKLSARLDKLEKGIADGDTADSQAFRAMETRLQHVEHELRHLPTREDLGKLQLGMSEMNANFRELAATLRPIAARVERINEWMLETPASRSG